MIPRRNLPTAYFPLKFVKSSHQRKYSFTLSNVPAIDRVTWSLHRYPLNRYPFNYDEYVT
jgi:hypothetical protein